MKSKQLNLLSPLMGITSALLVIILTIGCDVSIKPSDDDLTSDPELEERFTAYTTFEIDPADIYDKALAAGTQASFEISLPNGAGESWIAEVNKGNLLAEGFSAIEYGPLGEIDREVDMIALEGVIKETGASVHFVVSRSLFGGAIVGGSDVWYVDPITKHTKAQLEQTTQCVLYREQDAIVTAVGELGEDYIDEVGHEHYPDSPAPNIEDRAANCWKMQIRAHGDYEYYANKCGSNYSFAVYAIALNFSQAEAKFGPINLDFSLLSVGVFTSTSAAGYYPTSTNANTLLTQTRNKWNLNTSNRDLVILFTGKNVHTNGNYNTIGLAYIAVVCKSPTYAYGLVETGLGGNSQTNLLAHEIGHTLGAQHATSGIMTDIIYTGPTSFSSQSINQMNWHLWFNHGCLEQGACW